LPAWLMLLAGAELAGVAFCLLTSDHWDRKHVLKSVGWGALPGIVLAAPSLFQRRRGRRGLVPPVVLVMNGAVFAVLLVCVYHVLKFLHFLWTFEGFGSP
jgi:hypothetical protein